MTEDSNNPVAWRWRDNEHQTWNFIDADPIHMDYVFVEPLYVASPEVTAIQALRKIEDAAFGGYLTPGLCAEIVTAALSKSSEGLSDA